MQGALIIPHVKCVIFAHLLSVTKELDYKEPGITWIWTQDKESFSKGGQSVQVSFC